MTMGLEIRMILMVLSIQGAQQLVLAMKGLKQGFLSKHYDVLAPGRALLWSPGGRDDGLFLLGKQVAASKGNRGGLGYRVELTSVEDSRWDPVTALSILYNLAN